MSHFHKDQQSEHVHRLFESIAPKYDRMNSLLSMRQHVSWRRKAMQKMNVRPSDTALDICCGTCEWTIALQQASQSGKVVGLDFSSEMLKIGEEKINALDLKSITLVEGDAMSLPFPDDTFDHVTIGFALRNVSNIKVVLKEMKRVVKPGGQVVSLELSKPTLPVFKQLYFFYFEKILPALGYLFAKSYDQYRWLPESLRKFPSAKELKHMMEEEIGLEDVKMHPLTGGVACIHIGKKEGDGR